MVEEESIRTGSCCSIGFSRPDVARELFPIVLKNAFIRSLGVHPCTSALTFSTEQTCGAMSLQALLYF